MNATSDSNPDKSGADHLVLDWNGTVVDDLDRALWATNVVADRHRLPSLSAEEFQDVFILPMPAFFCSLGVAAEDIDAAEALWNERMGEAEAAPSPGIASVLEACRDRRIPVDVITGADPSVVSSDADRLGLLSFVTSIVGPSRDKGADLRRIRERDGTRIVYVGDTTYDVRNAKDAGVLAVAYTRGYARAEALRRAGPDVMVDHLADLIPLLRAG